MDFNNKIALVTGSASGIGLAVVKELLNNGIKSIAMVDINSEIGQLICDQLNIQYGQKRVIFIKANICNDEEIENAFKLVISSFGQLDILINNAGIANEETYERLIEINMVGATKCTLLGLKYMGKNQLGNGGIIISTSSIAAIEDQHAIPIYASTKAAILNLMRAFGHIIYYEQTGVKTMAILPGYTESNISINPQQNFGNINKFLDVFAARALQSYVTSDKNFNYTNTIFFRASAVAKSVLYILKNGESSSAWIIDDSKLYLLPPFTKGNYGKPVINNLNNELQNKYKYK